MCSCPAEHFNITSGRRQSKTLIPSTNVDKKSLETEFLIAICRPIGDKWQLKMLFLAIFDPRSSIVKSVFDCRLPGVNMLHSSPIFHHMCCIVSGFMVDLEAEWKIVDPDQSTSEKPADMDLHCFQNRAYPS